VDEITLFAALKPAPPDDLTGMRARTRARLGPAPGAPGEWTFEGADPATGAGSAPGGLRRLRSALQPGSRMGKPRRRRLAVGLSVVAVAVCAATVVPSVLLGGSGAPAYAVTRNPDGSVRVTIWDIAGAKDGADLQEALRAEGIRALVWAGSADQVPRTNPLCQAPASNLEPPMVQRAVVSDYPTDVPPGVNMVGTGLPNKGPGWVGFIIRPSAMPSGSVLYFSRLFMPVMVIARNGHGHIIARDSGQAIPPPEVLRHASLPC
jgi:hypothetical protein